MKSAAKLCVVAALIALALQGADISLPLEDGNIVLRNAQLFERPKSFPSTIRELILSYVIENHISNTLDGIDLEFKVGGFCNGEPRQWSYSVHEGYLPVTTYGKAHADLITLLSVSESVPGAVEREEKTCEGAIIKARIVRASTCAAILCASDQERRFEAWPSEHLEVEAELKAIQAERAKALADEQRKKQLAESEIASKYDAAQRAACQETYRKTSDKKLEELPAREAQQVQYCQLIGLYPLK